MKSAYAARMLSRSLLLTVVLLSGCKPTSTAIQNTRGAGEGASAAGRETAPATQDDIDSGFRDTADQTEVTPASATVEETPKQSGKPTQKQSAAPSNNTSANKRALFSEWPTKAKPQFVIVLTGQQHGYIEPCGCTGLEHQKGGMARRQTFLKQLSKEWGWQLIPIDTGDQVRRYGRQSEIKFQITVDGLKKMGYRATTFGLEDLKLSITEIAGTATDQGDSLFVSANIALLDREWTPRYKIVEVGKKRIAITAVLGEQARLQIQDNDVLRESGKEALLAVWDELSKQHCDYHVLIAQATLEETTALAKAVPHFQLVATSGGAEEPSQVPEVIPATPSLLINVGAKSMFASVIGIFNDKDKPWQFEKVPLDSSFADAKDMRDLMATYQSQLERLGLDGLGLKPVPHPSGRAFVGSKECKQCHAEAFAIWEKTPHHNATDSLVHPKERRDIARHFDPECLSCHVTGWNPQRFFPYSTGYLSLEKTPLLVGSGCENCHGPGSAHLAAEKGTDAAMQESARQQMRLPLDEAEKKCMECHDLDNSPDFHHDADGAFMKYWRQIEH